MMQSLDEMSLSGRIAYLACMTGLACVAGYLEMLLPLHLIGIPGVKLGIANVVTLTVLYTSGRGSAFFVMISRVLLVGFMFGSLYSIVYGLAGGLLSLLVMICLKHAGLFTITGVSAAGGTFHNIGQLIAAQVMLSGFNPVFYFPLLTVSGMLCGILTGVLAAMILQRTGTFFEMPKGNNDNKERV